MFASVLVVHLHLPIIGLARGEAFGDHPNFDANTAPEVGVMAIRRSWPDEEEELR